MRSAAIAVVATLYLATVCIPLTAQQPDGPPFGGQVRVVVNSQKSLAEAVGGEFPDEAWEQPAGLLPDEFPGFDYVHGPADRGLFPKGAWRKPVVLKDKGAGLAVTVNCYRLGEKKPTVHGTPFAPLLEPDYQYVRAEFHGLRTGTAAEQDRNVFAFRDGDRLFKIEAAGGKSEARRETNAAVAELIWKFRHSE